MTEGTTEDRWRDVARGLRPEGRAFIDGEYRAARDGGMFPSVNPATDLTVTMVADCGVPDVDDAVVAARRAFDDGRWRRLSLRDRKRTLLALAELMMRHRRELAVLETIDMGKPIRDADAVDVPSAAECVAWYGEALDKVYDQVAPVDEPATALLRREPLGVVAAVVPWNFPLLMTCWKIAPALAAGNSVVLKPSERASLSAIRLAGLALEAGLPPGVLNVVPGRGGVTGRALGLHMDVDCVAFTGSIAVGKRFLAYSAESNLKQVWPECGGKSAQIVLPDCDLDRAARGVASGIFFNQGQVCNAGSRLLVHEAVRDELLGRVADQAGRLQPGDPLDPATRFGAVVDAEHCRAVLAAVDDALGEGARLVAGGVRVCLKGAGSFVAPTVLDGVAPGMRVWREEVFGPVLAVATFRDEGEAVRLANESVYAIAAGVWTADLGRANRMAGDLRAGTVWINAFDRHAMATPFGGFRQSGFGRDRSLHALEKFTGLKTVWSQAA